MLKWLKGIFGALGIGGLLGQNFVAWSKRVGIKGVAWVVGIAVYVGSFMAGYAVMKGLMSDAYSRASFGAGIGGQAIEWALCLMPSNTPIALSSFLIITIHALFSRMVWRFLMAKLQILN